MALPRDAVGLSAVCQVILAYSLYCLANEFSVLSYNANMSKPPVIAHADLFNVARL